MYELNCHFQDAWVTKLVCVKSMVGFDGKVMLLSGWKKINETKLIA
jgi:hypothetical protein